MHEGQVGGWAVAVVLNAKWDFTSLYGPLVKLPLMHWFYILFGRSHILECNLVIILINSMAVYSL